MKLSKKRGLALVLAALLVLGGVMVAPLTASAAGVGMRGANNWSWVKVNETATTTTKVWFGADTHGNLDSTTWDPYQWHVIGLNESGVAPETDTMTLLLFSGEMKADQFNPEEHLGNQYMNSRLRKLLIPEGGEGWRLTNIPEREQNFMKLRELNDIEGTPTDKLWLLSTDEAQTLNQSLRIFPGSWWLRSPGTDYGLAAVVDGSGDDDRIDVENRQAGYIFEAGMRVANVCRIRPAFQLDLSSALFVSDATEGGTKPKAVGAALSAAQLPTNEVKFTMLDAHMAKPTVTLAGTTNYTSVLRFGYSGAETGTNQYLSCVLEQGEKVKYYGKLADCATDGSGVFSLATDGLAEGTYALKIFSEQANGNHFTDFASESAEYTLTVGSSRNGSVSGGAGGLYDDTIPTVLNVTPSGASKELSGDIVITFDEPMNTSAGTVLLDNNAGALTGGTWSNNNQTYTVPYFSLNYETEYTITVADFQDAAGNTMTSVEPSTFTTMARPVVPSDGSDSPSGGMSSAIITPPTAALPNQPTIGSVTAKVQGNAFTITDSFIKSALDKAQSAAKAQNRTSNGVGASLAVEGASAEGLTLTLERAALNRLISVGAKRFEITGTPLSLGFDVQALLQLQKQRTGNVTITTQPVTAKGVRNAHDITLTTVKDGKTVAITNLGTGTATLSIPTTPAKNEAAGALYAVYVGDQGKTSRIADSFYDANSGSVIFNTNHFSIYGVGYDAPTVKVTDIAAHWAKESIDYVLGRGLLNSNAQGKFNPNSAITRGELVTALGKLAGINVKAYTKSNFTDVKADSEALPYIAWASSKGILKGITSSQFAPEKAVTRQEVALILQNYAKATGDTLPVTRTAITFADASSIGSAYKASVKTLQQAGIVMGEQNNKFNPTANITRAEVSATLYRYIKLTIDPATAQGWAKNDDGQFQYYKDGKAVTGTQTIDGVKYVFNPNGTLKTGWVQEGSNWRYYSGNTMVTGWRNIGTNGVTKRYYFDAKGNRISGKWVEIGGAKYYFEADGGLNPAKK